MRGRLWGASVAASIAAAVLPTGVAFAAPGDPGNLLNLRLVNVDDVPLSGAVVHVYHVMPDVPDRYSAEPIAEGVADASGRVTAKIEPIREMVEAALANDGALNLQVLVNHVVSMMPSAPPSAEPTVDVPALPSASASPLPSASAEPVPSVSPVEPSAPSTTAATDVAYSGGDLLYATLTEAGVFGPGDEVIGAVLSFPDVVTVELTALSVLSGNTATDGPKCENYAPDREVVDRQAYYEPFGELHTYYDMSARIEYGAKANSDLWGGFQVNSGKWNVTANSNHMGQGYRAGVAAFRQHHVGRVFLTQFSYRMEKLTFYALGNRPCKVEHWIIPEKWLGAGIVEGADTSHMDGAGGYLDARRKSTTYVSEFGPHSTWYKSQGKASRYDWGVSAFGVGLKAQSTYDTNFDLRYSFGAFAKEPHYLYAPNSPIISAPTVYAY